MSLRRFGLILATISVIDALGYVGYVGIEASRQAVSVDEHRSHDCRTPDVRFGWAYEAINYPSADSDRRLVRLGRPGGCHR